jgi:D-glycero-beta-D-manno-heptose 1-phosphate adenylyltransferase
VVKGKKGAGGLESAVVVDTLDELADIVTCLKAEGKKIVLTNGTFDLLHVGHLRCLKDARSRGDYLIVGVNSDASVKKYKSAKLPVQKEDDRVEILAGLRWVDYLVKFGDATADALIAAVKPHIVAKGTDYTPESLPEKESIAACGAQVAICGDKKDHASSKIIDKIKKMK